LLILGSFILVGCFTPYFSNNSSNTTSSINGSTSNISSSTYSYSGDPIIIPKNYKILKDIYPTAMPSIGNIQALVIPIDFSDYPRLNVTVSLTDLEKTFFGKAEEVEWESLSSYYYKSSYGKLNISGQVLPWYRAMKPSSYYTSENLDNLLKDALSYHTSSGLNSPIYDSDKDGYFDAVYFIYSAPINEVDYNSIYWAFQSDYSYADRFNGVKLGKYIFAGIDFVHRVPGSTFDATTFIHETGHLLGLDDYYDYDYSIGPSGGLGFTDMMEYNVGDHSALSKILLGWVTPTVVVGKVSIILLPLLTNESVILVTNEWHNSIFDEYLLIDMYSYSDMNISQYFTYNEAACKDSSSYYCEGYKPPFSIDGVRIYHVDATLGTGGDEGYYSTLFNKNNSTTMTKFVKLVEADGRRDIEKNEVATNDDLYVDGDIFNQTIWKNYRFYDNKTLRLTISFTLQDDNSYLVDFDYR
jgi:M6 family metalloprotease-like protein